MSPLTFEKAVIVGAPGPIGIHLARTLRESALPVRVVSRNEANLNRYFGKRAHEILAADMLNTDDSRRAIDGCDLVFNCVGLPGHQMHQHPKIAKNIATAIAQTGARCVHVSSYWAYLPAAKSPLNESHPRRGGGPWAQHRRAAEDILQQAGAAILNLPDFYGPYVHTSTLQQALKDASQGKPMRWIGGVDTAHEYVFVPDAVHIAAKLASYEQGYGQRWIMPGAGPITGRRVAGIVSRNLSRPVRIRAAGVAMLRILSLFNRSLRGFMQLIPEYVKPISYDGAKLAGLIGKPVLSSYEDGIAETLHWLAAT